MKDTLGRLTTALSDRYRLDRELGQGGMATVYLAEDLKHDRKVAIKVLHPELSAVIGGDRFLSEIKTTASLQHPHILGLIDSGDADGLLYYVMPFIEGETLRARLHREKQLPVDDALRLTKEVASALEFAHKRGIVHRDIKPENILLQDGQALVADFGIALAVQQAGGSRMTQTGMSLGTPAYMSPEQAMGERELGARSDVYALGAMTYEMLTGEPPFTGPNSQAIVAKVLTEQPLPIRPKRPSVPPGVEHAVLIALQKLPADRFGTAKDYADALEGKGGGTYAATVAIPASRPSRLSRLPRPVMLAAAALLLTAAGAAGWFLSKARRAPAPVVRYAMALPEDQALADTRGHRITISPDGSRLVYVGHGPDGSQLWLRNRNQLRAAPIPGSNRATVPFFSPDGSHVGYVVEGNTEIRAVTLTGAPPITIADSGLGADGATWSEDGFIYFDGLTGGGTTGLVRVSASGGKLLEQVTTVDTAKGERDHFWPQALPGGRGILFTIQRAGNDDRNELAVLDTKTMKYHTLVQALTGRYSATGHLLYVTANGDLLAMPFSLDRLEVSGEPFAVTGSIKRRPFGAVDLTLSTTGTLMYITGTGAPEPSEIVYVNRDGSNTIIDSTLRGDFQTLALSPDGRRLALSKIDGTEQQLWVKQLPDGPLTKLTFEGNRSLRPAWSPDGQYISFIGNLGAGPLLYRKRADGIGASEQVNAFPGRAINEGYWSRDGKWLVFRTLPSDIFARRTSGDTAIVPLVQGSFDEIMPALSPDGRWLAYSSNESGTFETFVRPFPDAQSARWQVSTAGGFEAHWNPDGRELLYWTSAGQLWSVPVLPGTAFVTGQARALPIDGARYVGQIGAWDITPDGKRFVMIRQSLGKTEERELVVVENLSTDLKAPRTK